MSRRLKDVGTFSDEELAEMDRPRSKNKTKAEKPAKEKKKPTKKKKPIKDVAAPEFEISKLHNGKLEFMTLLRCVLDDKLQERLWPRLTEEHFAADPNLSLFKRLRTLHMLGKDWPKLTTLAADPAISRPAQAQIGSVLARAAKGKPLTGGSIKIGNGQEVPLETHADFEGHVFDLLEAYRVTRLGIEHFVDTVSAVAEDDEFDPLMGPEIVERAASEVLAIRGQESIADSLLHFGHGLTVEDHEKRQAELKKLFMADKPRFKIGIDAFDKRAGGFQGGEVVLLGSNTGGGKTAFQTTCMVNMARMGTSVAMLQLELSLEQVDERISSHLARIDSNLLRSGNIDQNHQKQIREAWSAFHDDCCDVKSRFTIYAPSSQTISGCEMVFKQYPYKVWFIDYVNLLDIDGENSKLQGWEKLSRITKAFKSLAKKYNICIVLGVQVNIDPDGNIEIRYAKAMKEDADIALVWHMDEQAKAEKAVWVKHLKARQYEPFDFEVAVHLEYGSFENLVQTGNKKKRTLGKSKLRTRDDVDLIADIKGFRKKDKPLLVDDDRSIMEAATAGDLVNSRKPLEVDDDYVGFDD